jgi:hypothetical protein
MTEPRDETVVERPQIEDYFSFVPYHAGTKAAKEKAKDETIVTPRPVPPSPSEEVNRKTPSETKNASIIMPKPLSYTPFDELDNKTKKDAKTASIVTSKPVSPNPSEELDHTIEIAPFATPKILSRNPSEEALKIIHESPISEVTTRSESSHGTSSDSSSATTACNSVEDLRLHDPSDEHLAKPTTPADTATSSGDNPTHPGLQTRRTASSSVLTIRQSHSRDSHSEQPIIVPQASYNSSHHATSDPRECQLAVHAVRDDDDDDEEGIYFPPFPEERHMILSAIVETYRQKKWQFMDKHYKYNAWGDDDAVRYFNETVQYRKHNSVSNFTVKVCRYLKLARKLDK